ncbi:rod shape-determining protein MreD [Flammeovirgaceae bacterium SG7u.111]|nr:rod shape-determining protein MreD [Flammeovirgaceae bacterium SG7u.132]WPO35195.1 rod shape-determining protein MreD [Flammeovirgaceae bacterium SG7u.111]
MSNKKIILFTISFFIYVLFQVIFLKNLVMFNVAFCYLYVAFLLSLPIETPKVYLLVAAFVLGLSVDIFYDTLGIHAAACTLIAYLRPFWIKLLKPRTDYESDSEPAVREMGLTWYILYAFPLLVIHHLLFFIIEASGLQQFWDLLAKTVATAVFTLFVIVIIQYLFYMQPKRRF